MLVPVGVNVSGCSRARLAGGYRHAETAFNLVDLALEFLVAEDRL